MCGKYFLFYLKKCLQKHCTIVDATICQIIIVHSLPFKGEFISKKSSDKLNFGMII